MWGHRYIDDLTLRDRDTDSNGTLDERLYGLHDQNWNLIAVSDTSGAIVERFRYAAYGNSIVLNSDFTIRSAGSSYGWETRFAAYRWDAESGAYHVRYRYHHPAAGRWLTRDRIDVAVSFAALYTYALNCPLSFVDPFGLAPKGSEQSFEEYVNALLANVIPQSRRDEFIRRYLAYIKRNGCVSVIGSALGEPSANWTKELTTCFKEFDKANDLACERIRQGHCADGLNVHGKAASAVVVWVQFSTVVRNPLGQVIRNELPKGIPERDGIYDLSSAEVWNAIESTVIAGRRGANFDFKVYDPAKCLWTGVNTNVTKVVCETQTQFEGSLQQGIDAKLEQSFYCVLCEFEVTPNQ